MRLHSARTISGKHWSVEGAIFGSAISRFAAGKMNAFASRPKNDQENAYYLRSRRRGAFAPTNLSPSPAYYLLRLGLHFTSALTDNVRRDFLPGAGGRWKEVIIGGRARSQAYNNTSFSPDWITIISCRIESLIARTPYDGDQLAPVGKQE